MSSRTNRPENKKSKTADTYLRQLRLRCRGDVKLRTMEQQQHPRRAMMMMRTITRMMTTLAVLRSPRRQLSDNHIGGPRGLERRRPIRRPPSDEFVGSDGRANARE